MKNKLNILFFHNETASRFWRADGIASRFHQFTEHEMCVASHRAWKGESYGADLAIIEMVVNSQMVDRLHELGCKVIYETDDTVMDSYGKERKNLMEISGAKKQTALDTIAKCDAVTVTNYVLKEAMERYTDKPVIVLPNYMDYEWYGKDNFHVKRTTDEIRLGWFGSKGHLEDLQMVQPAIKAVLEKYPNVKFVYAGFGGFSSNKMLTQVGWGEDVFVDIPRNRREFIVGVEAEMWPVKHRHMDLDIGICPVIDDFFNNCKSNIKWQEYAMCEIPTVCSPTLYAQHPISKRKSTVKHGKTGFIAKNTEEWIKYLSELIEDESLRKEIGKNAREEVDKNWNLDNHWRDWEKVYLDVVNETI
jgi:glycosyltransferase involved in cell wall biosynthesis